LLLGTKGELAVSLLTRPAARIHHVRPADRTDMVCPGVGALVSELCDAQPGKWRRPWPREGYGTYCVLTDAHVEHVEQCRRWVAGERHGVEHSTER
jgi:hypothetical protein